MELSGIWLMIEQVLRLEAGAMASLVFSREATHFALLIVLVAGVSEALGESLVLFVNRVTPRRFVLSVFISALLYAFSYALLTLSIYLVARHVFGAETSYGVVARLVAFSYVPRMFGFLTFIPFFGQGIGVLLNLWTLLALLSGLAAALALTPLQALGSVVLGALILFGLQSTVGRPIIGIARWLRQRAAGVDLVTDRRHLRALIDAEPDEGVLPQPGKRGRKPS